MAEFNLIATIKSGVEEALNTPVCDGKSIIEWAAIGMKAPIWISTQDRQPDAKGIYLARLGDGIYAILGYQDYGKGLDWYGEDPENEIVKVGNVTHWMPLPEPPEEVKQDD